MASRQLTPLPVSPGVHGARQVLREVTAAQQGGAAVLLLPEDPSFTPETSDSALTTEWPETAIVVPTSGSTGKPRQVEISQDAVAAAISSSHTALAGPGLWLTALPVNSIAGLMTMVRSVAAGVEPEIWPGIGGALSFDAESFRQSCINAQRRADAAGLPCYVSLVPTQVLRLVRDGRLAELARFDRVLIGGAALAPALVDELTAAGVSLVLGYGATETCGGVIYDGRPLPGVSVRIGDGEDGSESGLIEIATPSLASGYRGDPEATATAFSDGWFRTSDLGVLTNGVLSLHGRMDDIIKVGGNKVSLHQLSDAVRTVPGVLEAVALPLPDVEWGTLPRVFVVPDTGLTARQDDDDFVNQIHAVIRDHTRWPSRHLMVRIVDELPELPGGKVDRLAGEVE